MSESESESENGKEKERGKGRKEIRPLGKMRRIKTGEFEADANNFAFFFVFLGFYL